MKIAFNDGSRRVVEMESKMRVGKMLSLIGLRMKMEQRRVLNKIPFEVSDKLLMEIAEQKPMSIDEFLKMAGGKREIWNHYGDLIVKTAEKGAAQANSYTPWSKEEDQKLMKLAKDKTIREIATTLKRAEGAIRNRLQKLELEEYRKKNLKG